MEYDKHLPIPVCINVSIWTINYIVGDILKDDQTTLPRPVVPLLYKEVIPPDNRNTFMAEK